MIPRQIGNRLVLIMLASAAGILLALFVIQATLVNGLRNRNLPIVARVAPNHPDIVMRQALLEFQSSSGLTEPTYQRVLEAAPRSPLAYEPVLFKGMRLAALGQHRAAEPYMEEARRRDPRARLARLVLLDHYLRIGAVAPAALEVRAVMRLIPDTGEVLMPELVRLARDPATRAPLAEALAGDPRMDAILMALIASGAEPGVILDVASRSNMFRPGQEADRWRPKFLSSLLQSGQIEPARRLWAQFAGLDAGRPLPPIYDSEFRNLPGGPPFGWALVENAAGFAEYGEGPALVAEYYGREPARLATQLITLPPGAYRLSFQVHGRADPQGGRLAWKIRCNRTNQALLDLEIGHVGPQRQPRSADFAVPPGCTGQWLILTGAPAEFAADQNLTIDGLGVQLR